MKIIGSNFRWLIFLQIILISLMLFTSCNVFRYECDEDFLSNSNDIISNNLANNLEIISCDTSKIYDSSNLVVTLNDNIYENSDMEIFMTLSSIHELFYLTNSYSPEKYGLVAVTNKYNYSYYQSSSIDYDEFYKMDIYRTNSEYSSRTINTADVEAELLNLEINEDYEILKQLVSNNELKFEIQRSEKKEIVKEAIIYKMAIYEFVDHMYIYYDELEGEYTGDKWTKTIYCLSSGGNGKMGIWT